jgi:hypothetical protein
VIRMDHRLAAGRLALQTRDGSPSNISRLRSCPPDDRLRWA